MVVCSGTKRDGQPCTLPATQGSERCWNHDPALAERRSRNASRVASAKHSSVGKELREVRDLIRELLNLTLEDGVLGSRTRRYLQGIVQLLQCYLRAAELEMRAAEEPLKADLDAKGLRTQVLGRIEELEEREREKEEILSDLVPAMEAWGHDAEAVKAALGG